MELSIYLAGVADLRGWPKIRWLRLLAGCGSWPVWKRNRPRWGGAEWDPSQHSWKERSRTCTRAALFSISGVL